MFASVISDVTKVNERINDSLSSVGTLRAIVVFVGAIAFAYALSRIVTRLVVWIGQLIAVRTDTNSSEERVIQLRRVETYLSVTTALLRVLIVIVVGYLALRIVSPQTSGLATTIGAGTFVAIFATATVGPLLRDISAGAIMIIERWYSVGDFIQVVPFPEVLGVVERVTLRSTKIRNINGEVIWIHNQYMQGVRTTPRGVRTLAIDVFVHDLKAGLALIEDVCKTLPTGPTMLAHPLRIEEKEQLSKDLWRITIEGQTAPGREWLIEDFITSALKDADDENSKKKIIVYGPLVRNADETAERRYGRAVRASKD
jgi:small conductance mechanosensitive channel